MFNSLHKRLIVFIAVNLVILLTIINFVSKYSKDLKRLENINQLYVVVLSIDKLYSSGAGLEIKNYLEKLKFKEVKDNDFITNLYNIDDYPVYSKTNFGIAIGVMYENNYYLKLINHKNNTVQVYKSPKIKDIHSNVIYVFSFVFVLVFVIFSVVIWKWISPIKKLSKHVSLIGSEDYKDFIYNEQDEIGVLASELNKAAKKNNELVVARIFFLRAIMHELKTPIAKGMFAVDLVEGEKGKQLLKKVFSEMTNIINASKNLEEVLSSDQKIKLQTFFIKDLINKAIDVLHENDKAKVKVKIYKNTQINVDEMLFIVLLKNLIDNAIKYSIDNKCIVEFYKNTVIVKNKTNNKALNFEELKQPFVKGNNSSGYGLGLYLINYICNSQGFKLEYNLANSYHVFKVKL